MPIQNGTILTGSTVGATGGTSQTLSNDGQSVSNGVHVANMGVTDFRIREHVTFKNNLTTLDPATKKWGKGKKTCLATFPRVMADGLPGFPVLRIILEDYPEMSDAEYEKIVTWGAQLLTNASFKPFWKTGSTA